MYNRSSSHGQPSKPRKRALAVALVLAMGLPGLVFAQTAKEKELEARVAELEKMVQQLASQQQQQQAQISEAKTTQAAPAPAKPAIQGTPILTAGNPGSTFSYGGFIKLDAMVTDTSDGRIADGSSGRLFYVPSTIPVAANGAEPDSDPYTDFHAQFSRLWLGADHTTEGGDKLKAMVEMDFFGGGSNALVGNEVSTNTYAVSLRHAYVSWNNWLAGQTWSNFMDVAALPDAVDFVGVTDGTTFVRQAQVRYTKGPFSVAVENPETTVRSLAAPAAQVTSDENIIPDITARYVKKGSWGHLSVAGMLRQFKYLDETESGGAVSVSGKFNLGANDDIRYMANAGSGIGRYMAFGIGADAVLDGNNELQALDGYGGFVAWRHAFSPKLRGNLMYSASLFDNDKSLPGWSLASYGLTERSQSIHANLIYSPFPKLDVGAEIGYGKRELEDDREGDLKRIQTTVKYSF